MAQLQLALAQTNPVVGDLDGNADQVLQWSREAANRGAQCRSSCCSGTARRARPSPICDQRDQQPLHADRLERYEEQLGYNNPWSTEYGKFVKGIFVGREIQIGPAPGTSARHRASGSPTAPAPGVGGDEERLPATFSVAIGGAFLYLALGIPLGVAAARRRGTVADKALVSSFLVLSSVPYYLFALMTWLYVTVIFEVPFISDTGYFPFTENPAKWFSGHAARLDRARASSAAPSTRATPAGPWSRPSGEDYIRTAKAKGLPARTWSTGTGCASALVPVVTIFGIDFGVLLAGTIFTEKIFDIQGIGYWGLAGRAAPRTCRWWPPPPCSRRRCLIISNIIVDVIYSVLDPRVRLS